MPVDWTKPVEIDVGASGWRNAKVAHVANDGSALLVWDDIRFSVVRPDAEGLRNKPVDREGWVNVWGHETDDNVRLLSTWIYPTQEEAIADSVRYKPFSAWYKHLATVKITWKE